MTRLSTDRRAGDGTRTCGSHYPGPYWLLSTAAVEFSISPDVEQGT